MNQAETLDLDTRIGHIVDLIMDKKGEDIVVLDLRGITSIADTFILTTGNSSTQVKAIAGEIRDKMKHNYGEHPWHIEGLEGQKWVLIDFVDVVVHVFDAETRSYYDLEHLWKDARSRKIETQY